MKNHPLVLSGLLVLLGCSSTALVIDAAIAPRAAHAYTSRVDLTIDIQTNETFEALVKRAELIARAATQRSFDRDILITQVSVIVVGEINGLSVPILGIDVSRLQWRNRPDTRRWATYYPSAKPLLEAGQQQKK